MSLLSIATLLTTISLLGFAERSIAEDLILGEGEVKDIDTGAHHFDLVELRKNSTLRIKGTTDIYAGRIISGERARVMYESSSREANGVFNLTTRDASALQDLSIVTNGKIGDPDFATDAQAGPGGVGRGASDPDPIKLKKGNSAGHGGNGRSGAAGGDGENALDVTLYLPLVKPGALVAIASIGGPGGAGQGGGRGGKGGKGSITHDCKNGGNGGNGGAGGRGGNAGKVAIYLVVADVGSEAAASLKKGFQVRANTARGVVGRPGAAGTGGAPGDRGGNPNVCDARPGYAGKAGPVGAEGQGPSAAEDAQYRSWVVVDLMSAADYAAYLDAKERRQNP